MVLFQRVVAAAAIVASANAIPGYGSCPASDKCLNTVKANKYAAKDCKAAFQKTVTTGKPCTKTVFAKSTKTVTQRRAAVNTVVSTVTTITVTPTQSLVARETPVLEARNEKRAPPTYATKSCNVNQYMSACSCIGVRPSTRTVAAAEKTTTVTRTTTVKKTVTSTATKLATATVTANPDDAVPTGIRCQEDGVFQLYSTARRVEGGSAQGYLHFDNNGIATLGENHQGGTDFFLTKSGLLREVTSPNLALKTVEGEDLTYVFGSEDIGGAVLRCSYDDSSSRFTCLQGNKDTFYLCPAQTDGSTVVIANYEAVTAGTVGEGCK